MCPAGALTKPVHDDQPACWRSCATSHRTKATAVSGCSSWTPPNTKRRRGGSARAPRMPIQSHSHRPRYTASHKRQPRHYPARETSRNHTVAWTAVVREMSAIRGTIALDVHVGKPWAAKHGPPPFLGDCEARLISGIAGTGGLWTHTMIHQSTKTLWPKERPPRTPEHEKNKSSSHGGCCCFRVKLAHDSVGLRTTTLHNVSEESTQFSTF